uniref:Photosystem I assembly protein Ycf4 n=1 Tax=Sporolithon durum TaxID=48970 RepID=A0A141SCV6_9FLOR|nr:photosystem I assembly protein Ycf4 [Sporolithon durum]AMK96124.1 photosystem I assembly protein Ycf4 [Sporolithon durum]
MSKYPKIRIDQILGSRRFSNYWWATIILFGGLGFILVGLASYLRIDIYPFTKSPKIIFIPQGIIMVFYGTTGMSLSLFLWLTIFWNVGAGYNEFNNEKGLIKVFRLGFPGKNRQLYLEYKLKDIQAISVNIQEGISPKHEIYLKTKDNRKIPLTRVGEPLLLSDIEEQATELAKFLGIILEGVNI